MIDGVVLTPLKVIPDARGQVMKMIQSNQPPFQKFGEVYFSFIYPGVIKGWKLHHRSTTNVAVPVGRVQYVLHDCRESSPTYKQSQTLFLGDNAFWLLTIPPGIAYGWKNLIQETAVVCNCASEVWSADESVNLPLEAFGF